MFNNSDLTKTHSKIYGRHIQKVRELIKQIEMKMYEEEKSLSKEKRKNR